MNKFELSVQEFATLDLNEYYLIDIRDTLSYSYGYIPGSKNISNDELNTKYREYEDKKVIVYCKKGEVSKDTVKYLREKGLDAWNLTGGYLAWLVQNIDLDNKDKDDKSYCLEVERSLQKNSEKVSGPNLLKQ